MFEGTGFRLSEYFRKICRFLLGREEKCPLSLRPGINPFMANDYAFFYEIFISVPG
jgi:hypothetical protein